MSYDPTAQADTTALQASAKKHLWPHFTNRKVLNDGIPVVTRAEGHHIYDAAGKKYFDGLSGLFVVNAGHGLHYHNVEPVAAIAGINELNIGHALVAHALFVGFRQAVAEMKALMLAAANR